MDPARFAQTAEQWGYTTFVILWYLLPYVVALTAFFKALRVAQKQKEAKAARDAQVSELQASHEENKAQIQGIVTEVVPVLKAIQDARGLALSVGSSPPGAALGHASAPPTLAEFTTSLATLFPIFAGHAEKAAETTANNFEKSLQMQRTPAGLVVIPTDAPAPQTAPPADAPAPAPVPPAPVLAAPSPATVYVPANPPAAGGTP